MPVIYDQKNNVAHLSLGSNMKDRYNHLMEAIQFLKEDEHIDLLSSSSIYETEPVGYTDQHAFLNMVLKVSTSYKPLELLETVQNIEQKGGRKRDIRWGPRTIDLDILLYNNENINLKQLIIPHPRMFERGFVLIPFKEVESSYTFTTGKTIDDYIDELPDKEGVQKWKNSFGEEESERTEN
ncbi:2-amino-4-hydroxy-6-hydroxymethyldihydropteridine diphosphokinase [Evansella halocellulosilytica]|uniref:2-amino-4-hydroxy-6- hydroxymethyldihydropteridine diphosphokinase n=1 Tax=Evansella halocellulosilytica TaxID=2011013 RepID=UPI000BB755F2|nr:2-amino-4-hydroxy-6-hydroxymethyldihydropteridine diphosphokinase [Evansella halocellulosilytica]